MNQSAPKVTVSGVGGLKVYGIDYNTSSTDAPSELTVRFINKRNIFTTPELSYLKPSRISIGSFSFNMYPVSYKEVRAGDGQNFLEVKYVDGSFILDKFYVGLKTKQWEFYDPNTKKNLNGKAPMGQFSFNANPINPRYTIPNFMIIVGELIDPCRNKNTEKIHDPCDLCPSTSFEDQEQAKLIDCIRQRSMSVLDVDYNFNDLLAELKKRGFRIDIRNEYDANYRAQYIGSLRSVIQSWCSDFGFSFAFSAQTNKIVIYDVGAGIDIPTFNGVTLTGKTESVSIEHNHADGVITRYAQTGQERPMHCEASYSQMLTCRPLTLQDLIGNAKWREGMPLYSPDSQNLPTSYFDTVEFASVLSSYHPSLREAVTWFDLYGIKKASDAKALITTQLTKTNINGITVTYGGYTKSPMNDDTNRHRYSLPALAMTIKSVISSKDDELSFNFVQQFLGENQKKRIEDMKNKGFKNPYFVIASRGEELWKNNIQWEQNVGNNFLGRFFIRKYLSNSKNAPSFQPAPDSSVKFYKMAVDQVEFAQYMPYKGSYIDELSNKKGRAEQSFVLVNRTVKPNPPNQEGTDIANLIKLADEARPIELGAVNDIFKFNNLIPNIHPSAKGSFDWGADDKVFLVFEGKGFSTSINFTPTKYPDLDFSYTDTNEYSTPATVGLQSLNCISCNVWGIKIYYPPSSTVRESHNGGNGYNVFYRTGSEYHYNIFVPKTEFVERNIPDAANLNVGSLNIKLNDYNNNLFQDVVYDPINKNCLPNERQIRADMINRNSNLAFVKTTPYRQVSYDIEGEPPFDVENFINIESFSLRVSEKGLKGAVTFSNLINKKIPKSDKFLEFKYLEDVNPPYLSHHQFTKRTNLVSSQNNRVVPWNETPPINQKV